MSKKPLYDNTDNRLVAALHAVEVPAELRFRLERSLQVAMEEHELSEATALSEETVLPGKTVLADQSPQPKYVSRLWNRRTAIATTLAAGLGGLLLGYRQLTQPISQSQLVESTQILLDQVKRNAWQPLTATEAVAVKRSLQDIGFSTQVRNVSLSGFMELQPVRTIQRAFAYDLGSELILLDLTIERGVQRVTHVLNELARSRSDMVAFAMSSEQRTLVLAGPASIRKHILPAQTT